MLALLGLLGLWPLERAVVTQTTQVSPSFEVASIKQNTSGDTTDELGLPAGRFTARNVPLRTLILLGYGVRERQLVDGPEWIRSARYDINATSGTPLMPSMLAPYLRQLLEDRFGVRTHRDSRELPVYALTLARSDGRFGPDLRRPDRDYCAEAMDRQQRGLPALPLVPGQPARCQMRGGPGVLTVRSMPLSAMAGQISEPVGRMVIDRTGLEGVFDLDLKWTSDQGGADPSGPSLFTALQEQLGLKLEPTRAPMEVLVVDRVERPTPD